MRPPYNRDALCKGYKPAEDGEAKIINNDVIPQDWQRQAQDIIVSAEKNTKNGSIILLHDGSQNEHERKTRPEQMFKALPTLIEILQTRGFELVRLDELNLE